MILFLTSDEIKELNERVEYYKRNPDSAKDWKEVVGKWKTDL